MKPTAVSCGISEAKICRAADAHGTNAPGEGLQNPEKLQQGFWVEGLGFRV